MTEADLASLVHGSRGGGRLGLTLNPAQADRAPPAAHPGWRNEATIDGVRAPQVRATTARLVRHVVDGSETHAPNATPWYSGPPSERWTRPGVSPS